MNHDLYQILVTLSNQLEAIRAILEDIRNEPADEETEESIEPRGVPDERPEVKALFDEEKEIRRERVTMRKREKDE